MALATGPGTAPHGRCVTAGLWGQATYWLGLTWCDCGQVTQPVQASDSASVVRVRIAMWIKQDDPDRVQASGKNIMNDSCMYCYFD